MIVKLLFGKRQVDSGSSFMRNILNGLDTGHLSFHLALYKLLQHSTDGWKKPLFWTPLHSWLHRCSETKNLCDLSKNNGWRIVREGRAPQKTARGRCHLTQEGGRKRAKRTWEKQRYDSIIDRFVNFNYFVCRSTTHNDGSCSTWDSG